MPWMTVGQFLLGCREKEWNDWLPRRKDLLRQWDDDITQATKLLEGVSLSLLFHSLVSNPAVIGKGGPELVAMVMANTERRNDDNSNMQRLLLC
jgi:hypothetical protein